MRWFGCFQAAKKKKDQTTSGNHQNAADPNQVRRHKKFLSGKSCCLPVYAAASLNGIWLRLRPVNNAAYRKGR